MGGCAAEHGAVLGVHLWMGVQRSMAVLGVHLWVGGWQSMAQCWVFTYGWVGGKAWHSVGCTLRAPLSGTFLQTLLDLVTALKRHFISAQLSTDAVIALRKVQVLI